jgi:hypothetical protein
MNSSMACTPTMTNLSDQVSQNDDVERYKEVDADQKQ